MNKNLIILSEWNSKDTFHQLYREVESNISGNNSFSFLFWVNNPKDLKNISVKKGLYYCSRNDFTLFGKLKSRELIDLLTQKESNILIVATETKSKWLSRIIKNNHLKTIGIEKKTLPNFNISFRNARLEEGNLFKQINNYLTKIQL